MTTKTDEQERADFEAWARRHLGMPEHIAFNWEADWTLAALEGYRAGRAALQSQAPDTVDALSYLKGLEAGQRAALQSQEYTSAIGEAGQAYIEQFKNAHALPAEFRWSELWAVMCVAANKGRTDILQSQDREDAERLDWLQQSDGRFHKLLHITSIVGRGFSPTNSSDKWFSSLREAIDHARRIEE